MISDINYNGNYNNNNINRNNTSNNDIKTIMIMMIIIKITSSSKAVVQKYLQYDQKSQEQCKQMKLIRTIKKSVRKNLSVETYRIQQPVNRFTNQANQLVHTQ